MNALKWILAVLILFVGLFLLSTVTGTFDEDSDDLANYAEEVKEVSVEAKQLYTNFGCSGCHGNNLEGTPNGPALVKLSEHWDRDGLINYIRNPKGFEGGDRFKEYKKKYSKVIMPGYDRIEVKKLGELADYLLTK